MSGFGRGGRGAALRQALEQQVRKPGEQQEAAPREGFKPKGCSRRETSELTASGPAHPPTAHPPAQSPTAPTQPAPGRGRAALLQLLQQHTQGTGSPAVPQPGRDAPIKHPSPPTGPRARGQPSPPLRPQPSLPAAGQQRPSAGGPLQSEAKHGTSGVPIEMRANYLRLLTTSEGVYQYTVTYSPNVDSNNVRFALMNEFKDIIGDTRAFDGATLYLPRKITDSSVSRSVQNIKDGRMVEVTIALVKLLPHEECLHLVNLFFKRAMRKLNLKQIGRNTYDPTNRIQVPQHKLELWPGYVTAISKKDGGLVLMLDVSHRVLRQETVLDFFYTLYANHQHGFQEEATRQILGCVVLTRYNNRTYRVDDIVWDKNPQSTFVDSSGQPVRFLDYYKKQYNLDISDHEQPLLVHRPKKREKGVVGAEGGGEDPDKIICLIPELCNMTGLSDVARSDFRVMKDLAAYTRVPPAQRELTFHKFLSSLSSNPAAMKELTSWGLQLDQSTLSVSGRLLPTEKITFGGLNRVIQPGPIADFGREAMQEQMITAVPLKNWVVVFSKKDRPRAYEFVNMVKKVCPPLGMVISEPQASELLDDRTDTYLRAIRDVLTPRLQLVVCVFPTQRDDRYSAVKKLCCCDRPVPSQCINSRTIGNQQKLKSVTQKIVLQVNAKLGGELWSVDIPMKTIMIIGIDVYHERGRRSVAGFVASMNRSMSRWYSRIVFQTERQELVTGLRVCMTQALNKYHEVNGSLPERIIVFRDGVGEGQASYLTELEIPQMVECFRTFGDQYQPKFGVTVVQKRINTRLIATKGRDLMNPPPGTILDHTVTKKDVHHVTGGYDFFLVSQNVREGTVSPSHYRVVYDTTGLKPDHMQRLAYKLTYMYYNWPGTIRVPAPCQYAHKLAFLVGQSLQREPSNELSDRLFFL